MSKMYWCPCCGGDGPRYKAHAEASQLNELDDDPVIVAGGCTFCNSTGIATLAKIKRWDPTIKPVPVEADED